MFSRRLLATHPRLVGFLAVLWIAAVGYASPAVGQIKWADTKGRIHYTDLPPPANAKILPMGPAVHAAGAATEEFPAELANATKRNPVVLYTTTECAPCQQARTHLSQRGVPYSERTITASADIEAFRKLGFTQESFPSVAVGKERAQGFEPAEWNRLIGGAGYPDNAVLPPSYKQTPATPLAPRGSTAAAAEATNAAARPAYPPLPKSSVRF